MATLTLTQAATTAAQWLGVLDSGESLSSQQIADALLLANIMLDSWSSDPKKITSLTRASGNLQQGIQSYTIGTGQAINVARPAAIVSAAFLNSSGPGGPVKVCNASEWASIQDRQRESFIITDLFYDRGFPSGNVYVSPLPQGSSLALEVLVWAPLAQFVDAATPLTLLPGYERLIISSLAIQMAPQYDVDPVPDLIQGIYSDALGNVEELNSSLFGILTDSQKSMITEAAAAEGK
jgi:hypothetical protein